METISIMFGFFFLITRLSSLNSKNFQVQSKCTTRGTLTYIIYDGD